MLCEHVIPALIKASGGMKGALYDIKLFSVLSKGHLLCFSLSLTLCRTLRSNLDCNKRFQDPIMCLIGRLDNSHIQAIPRDSLRRV